MADFKIPAVFQNGQMADAFKSGIAPTDDSLSEGIAQGYGVIGYKGGKAWTLRIRGDKHIVLDLKTGQPSPHLDVIILQQAKVRSKSYYPGQFKGDASDGQRPVCASLNGEVPDVDVVEKQHDNCPGCPHNVLKTNPETGRKGKECTDYKRLAVLVLPTQTTPILGEPLMEPVFLRVPPASLQHLATMGDSMARAGHHYYSYITRITFDPTKAHPEMVFTPLQGLTNAEAPVVNGMREDPLVERIIGSGGAQVQKGGTTLASPGASATGLSAPARTTLAAPSTSPAPAPQPLPAFSAPAEKAISSFSAREGVVPPATPSLSSLGGASSNGGSLFGGASTASAAPPPSAATQMVADAGTPDTSDAALDAKIAALINGGK
jgi:hypothetical protein